MALKNTNNKLKRLTRERMKATGEKYTKARRAVLAEFNKAKESK